MTKQQFLLAGLLATSVVLWSCSRPTSTQMKELEQHEPELTWEQFRDRQTTP